MLKHTLLATSLALLLTGCLATTQNSGKQTPQTISPEHIEMVRTLGTSQLNELAQKGDQYAQYYLGNKYAQGAEVPQDMTQAKRYWELAAKQDNANALYNLGMTYYSGQGSAKNPETALAYFQKAAQAGNSRAALNAGNMFETGQGTIANIPVAAQFYQLAAQEQPHAAYRLGLLYTLNTPDFPADYTQAYNLFQQAAMKGDRFAPRALNIMTNYPQEQAVELLKRLNNGI